MTLEQIANLATGGTTLGGQVTGTAEWLIEQGQTDVGDSPCSALFVLALYVDQYHIAVSGVPQGANTQVYWNGMATALGCAPSFPGVGSNFSDNDRAFVNRFIGLWGGGSIPSPGPAQPEPPANGPQPTPDYTVGRGLDLAVPGASTTGA